MHLKLTKTQKPKAKAEPLTREHIAKLCGAIVTASGHYVAAATPKR